MPTVEADVAFGLGKFNLTRDEVRSRVSNSLDAVGMLSYQQVDLCSYFKYYSIWYMKVDKRKHLILYSSNGRYIYNRIAE